MQTTHHGSHTTYHVPTMYCPTCSHLNLPGVDQCAKCQADLAPLDVPAAHDRVEASLMADKVSVLHPRPAVTVRADDTLAQAMATMLDRGVGAVLVVDGETLAGILTERDFLTKVAGQPGFERQPVRDYMTAGPETVAEDDPLAFAVRKMDVGGYRHLAVLPASGKTGPSAVISVRDVLRHITKLCKDA
jgi:CBS domain-containing protein